MEPAAALVSNTAAPVSGVKTVEYIPVGEISSSVGFSSEEPVHTLPAFRRQPKII